MAATALTEEVARYRTVGGTSARVFLMASMMAFLPAALGLRVLDGSAATGDEVSLDAVIVSVGRPRFASGRRHSSSVVSVSAVAP